MEHILRRSNTAHSSSYEVILLAVALTIWTEFLGEVVERPTDTMASSPKHEGARMGMGTKTSPRPNKVVKTKVDSAHALACMLCRSKKTKVRTGQQKPVLLR